MRVCIILRLCGVRTEYVYVPNKRCAKEHTTIICNFFFRYQEILRIFVAGGTNSVLAPTRL